MRQKWDGSGFSWTICKQSAPHSRQITSPTPHHSIFIFYGPDALPDAQPTVSKHWRYITWSVTTRYKMVIYITYRQRALPVLVERRKVLRRPWQTQQPAVVQQLCSGRPICSLSHLIHIQAVTVHIAIETILLPRGRGHLRGGLVGGLGGRRSGQFIVILRSLFLLAVLGDPGSTTGRPEQATG